MLKGKMLRQKTSKQGALTDPQEKTKEANVEIQTRTQNISRVVNQVDVAEKKYLPEEETTLQEDREVI